MPILLHTGIATRGRIPGETQGWEKPRDGNRSEADVVKGHWLRNRAPVSLLQLGLETPSHFAWTKR